MTYKKNDSYMQRATDEVKALIMFEAHKLVKEGWSYEVKEGAPNTYEALVEQVNSSDTGQHILISPEGSDTSIYGAEINAMFRFWCDALHLLLDADFSLQGELRVIARHQQAAFHLNLSHAAKELLKFDTEGQVRYYFKTKRFVPDQAQFLVDCVNLTKKSISNIDVLLRLVIRLEQERNSAATNWCVALTDIANQLNQFHTFEIRLFKREPDGTTKNARAEVAAQTFEQATELAIHLRATKPHWHGWLIGSLTRK